MHMIAKKRLSRCCNFDRCAVSIRSLGSLKKLKMAERDWVKQHLVCAIVKFDMFAVNRRFMLEGCCFLQEPDSTVFLFLKKKATVRCSCIFKTSCWYLGGRLRSWRFCWGARTSGEAARGVGTREIPLPLRLCRSRALSNKTASYAGYRGGGGGGEG